MIGIITIIIIVIIMAMAFGGFWGLEIPGPWLGTLTNRALGGV